MISDHPIHTDHLDGLTREDVLPDAALDCAHLAVRPMREADAYVCDTCQRELTTIEAQEVSSEAPLRLARGLR